MDSFAVLTQRPSYSQILALAFAALQDEREGEMRELHGYFFLIPRPDREAALELLQLLLRVKYDETVYSLVREHRAVPPDRKAMERALLIYSQRLLVDELADLLAVYAVRSETLTAHRSFIEDVRLGERWYIMAGSRKGDDYIPYAALLARREGDSLLVSHTLSYQGEVDYSVLHQGLLLAAKEATLTMLVSDTPLPGYNLSRGRYWHSLILET